MAPTLPEKGLNLYEVPTLVTFYMSINNSYYNLINFDKIAGVSNIFGLLENTNP